MAEIFVAGIDTGIGKSYGTGLMARYLARKNKSVITQKIAQTGCIGISEDIILHRNIMEMKLTKFDRDGTTCPYVFEFPASPHLAADLENRFIDPEYISSATERLSSEFDHVIIEGVGGLMVPLNKDVLLIDYIKGKNYPVILVSSSVLGSINHTILSIESLIKRDITLKGIMYSRPTDEDKTISDDTRNIISNYLRNQNINAPVIDIPYFELNYTPDIDFSNITL